MSRRCPYDFRTGMPAGEYCVYRGVIATPAGTICNGDAVLICGLFIGVMRLPDSSPASHVAN